MRRRQSGHAILELAASAAVMVSCLAGTFQFGHTFYVYNQLVTAVGNGGRYAATRTYRPLDLDKARNAIRNMVVYGDARPAPGAAPVVANLTPDQVDVHWVREASGTPTAVGISIHNFRVDTAFKTFTFTGRPGVEFPFVGRYAPTEREP